MNTVMRLDNNGELYFQPKKDYIDELKQKIADLEVKVQEDYRKQLATVTKAKGFFNKGNKYEALMTLEGTALYSYTGDRFEVQMPRKELMQLRDTILFDILKDAFKKSNVDVSSCEVAISSNPYQSDSEICYKGETYSGYIIENKIGRKKNKYFLPLYALDMVKNIEDYRITTRMVYSGLYYSNDTKCHIKFINVTNDQIESKDGYGNYLIVKE